VETENVYEVQICWGNETGTAPTSVTGARLGDKFEADGTVQTVVKERSEDVAVQLTTESVVTMLQVFT
jgi:hypothetical protein